MPSTQQIRENDELIGAGLIGILLVGTAAGIILNNRTLIETWLPRLLGLVLLFLFYRLVVAVETIADRT